jgi:hypothetical protein
MRGSGVLGVRATLGEEAHMRAFPPGLGGRGAAHARDGATRNSQLAIRNPQLAIRNSQSATHKDLI